MKIKFLFLLPFVPFALGLNSYAATATAAPAGDSATVLPKMETMASGPEAGLRQGMPATEIKRIMGNPDDTKPMKSPNGTAEVWLYRVIVKQTQQEIPVMGTPTTRTEQAGGSNTQTVVTGTAMSYKTVRMTVYRKTSLLVFNGALLNQKVTYEQEMSSY